MATTMYDEDYGIFFFYFCKTAELNVVRLNVGQDQEVPSTFGVYSLIYKCTVLSTSVQSYLQVYSLIYKCTVLSTSV